MILFLKYPIIYFRHDQGIYCTPCPDTLNKLPVLNQTLYLLGIHVLNLGSFYCDFKSKMLYNANKNVQAASAFLSIPY